MAITKDTVKRLISDIKDIIKSPLNSDGIYYKHDESNMLLGYALIIARGETPYLYGNFLFKFIFPSNYPHSPPTVYYCTNDGVTRFHPNYYKCGKICLSVLNTWKGEQWTGCQTIRSILLTLCSLLDDNPLLNEPGIVKAHRDIINYNKIIRYKSLEIGLEKMLDKTSLPPDFNIFYDIIVENFIKNYSNILKDLKNGKDEKLLTGVYGLTISTDYTTLYLNIVKNFEKLTSEKLN